MNTTTIYRLQHPVTGIGPWRRSREKERDLSIEEQIELGRAVDALNEHYDNDVHYRNRHPAVMEDFGFSWHFKFHCAAPTLEMLRAWFAVTDDVINALYNAGFTVIEYTVDADNVWYSRSGRQVGFDPHQALSSRDLTILALIED